MSGVEISSNLTAAAAVMVAGVTAAFASLKFFSDKSAKITDFRKAWVETLRQAVAEFSGSTHTIAGRIAIRKKHGKAKSAVKADSLLVRIKNSLNGKPAATSPFDKDFESELLQHWLTLRLSYNKIILHHNPIEHKAYLIAETGLAEFFNANKESDTNDPEVINFLKECIELAEDKVLPLMDTQDNFFKRSRHRATKWYKKPKGDSDAPSTKTLSEVLKEIRQLFSPTPETSEPLLDPEAKAKANLTKIKNHVKNECGGAAHALLLATFATRQLLYGAYNDVYARTFLIEKGIRVVDTSSAIVIKQAWSSIKNGELKYRIVSWASLIFSFTIVVAVIVQLYNDKPSQPQNTATPLGQNGPAAKPAATPAQNGKPSP